ncbi:DNA-binding transcriptional MerR regulator [Actinoalloteichus hoggarensis]|uniref:HTH-type transcriptional activator TipA n=1 Tax=Actinoalloteichus hoggarensis TaxID=1470176 RepID=A0A221WAL3_9PSEU|nr:MerR family transcriptional regulator [Actinoalloteichus hoggarensis]ASO23012.1 HTH-type transcriptional activator TipA [Actinoalloteichus hoggarensis]MBB5922617.1 DNA-binding transcriptional MerR regulator [Actinoalloteichus hoggarensis]
MMFTIGRLSEIAGVSVRTIRHYHQIGLLAEPARDGHGHRRYGSAELIMVLRVRRLVEIGFALREIADLLDAPPEVLRGSLDELDAELASRQEHLAARRAALARFRELDHDPRLPESVARAQAMMRDWGMPPAVVEAERDAVLLATAMLRPATGPGALAGSDTTGDPSEAAGSVEPPQVRALFDDVYTSLIGVDGGRLSRRLYQEMDAVRDLPADHPRVDALLETSIEFLTTHTALLRRLRAEHWQASVAFSEATVTTLFEDFLRSMPPAHLRLVRTLGRFLDEQDAAEPDADST